MVSAKVSDPNPGDMPSPQVERVLSVFGGMAEASHVIDTSMLPVTRVGPVPLAWFGALFRLGGDLPR